MKNRKFWIYIISNKSRTKIYIGVTNNLRRRINEHKENINLKNSWASKNDCRFLIYYETFDSITFAIKREKQLKKWSRKKKNWLIKIKNPHLLELTCSI